MKSPIQIKNSSCNILSLFVSSQTFTPIATIDHSSVLLLHSCCLSSSFPNYTPFLSLGTTDFIHLSLHNYPPAALISSCIEKQQTFDSSQSIGIKLSNLSNIPLSSSSYSFLSIGQINAQMVKSRRSFLVSF